MRRKSAAIALGIVGLVSVCIIWRGLCKRMLAPDGRPMFHDNFGLHPDHGIVKRWWPLGPEEDGPPGTSYGRIMRTIWLVILPGLDLEANLAM